MVSISASDVSFTERIYTEYKNIPYTDSNTASVSIKVFPYDSANYNALKLYYSSTSISAFNTNIGLNNIQNWILSGCSSENSSLSILNIRTTANTNNFLYYERIKLKANKQYNLTFNVSTTGTASITGNLTAGIQYHNGTSYVDYFSSTANYLVATTGFIYIGSTFSPTADGYYRIILSSASGINKYIQYSNISLNFPTSNENMISLTGGFTPLQLVVIKPARQIYQDTLNNVSILFNNYTYSSTNIEDESVLDENNTIITDLSGNAVGHIINPMGLIIFNNYNLIKSNNNFITNYYQGISWTGSSVATSASLSALSLCATKTNYSISIKSNISSTSNVYTSNASMVRPDGQLYYNKTVFVTGFKVLDDSLSSLLVGKISVPTKKNDTTELILTLRAEN